MKMIRLFTKTALVLILLTLIWTSRQVRSELDAGPGFLNQQWEFLNTVDETELPLSQKKLYLEACQGLVNTRSSYYTMERFRGYGNFAIIGLVVFVAIYVACSGRKD
jgi:hypothetical protein